MHRLCFALAVFPFCLALGGCGGSNTFAVTGKVSFEDGSPVPGGMIVFHPAESKDEKTHSADGTINADGTFKLRTFKPGDGAFVGNYKVTVIDPPSGGDDEDKRPPLVVDPKFAKPETSGLTFQVKAEANVFNITVKKAAKGARNVNRQGTGP